MLCILWLTAVYWNRPQFILLRQAAGLWKPGKPSCSISLTRGDERQSRIPKVRTELGQLKIPAMACAFSSLAWVLTGEFGHLLLSFNRSFVAGLSKGCSDVRSKMILQSIELVPASGPYVWMNNQMFQGDSTMPQECMFSPEASRLSADHEVTLCCKIGISRGWWTSLLLRDVGASTCTCSSLHPL